MDAISYSAARKNFAETMEQVCDEHEPVIITRQNARAVVMMSLEDFNSLEETCYLLRSPANAKYLRESFAQYESGKFSEKKLIEANKNEQIAKSK